MCKLIQTLQIMTRDEISSLRSFRVETEPKPLFSHITRYRVMRAQKLKLLRLKMCDLVFEDLKDSTKNLCFEFKVVSS